MAKSVIFQTADRDTNPDEEEHWMYKNRESEGLLRFVSHSLSKITHTSIGMADGQRQGKQLLRKLDRGLVGLWHDRYFKGTTRNAYRLSLPIITLKTC